MGPKPLSAPDQRPNFLYILVYSLTGGESQITIICLANQQYEQPWSVSTEWMLDSGSTPISYPVLSVIERYLYAKRNNCL